MAGEQDILSLGLNIDSFNQQKMNVLKQYIALFNDLNKFDNKIFNPVMGDGLTKFNTSIAETNKLIDQMNLKLGGLVNNSTKVKQSFSNIGAGKKDIFDLNYSIVQTGASIEKTGKSLTGMLSVLRNVAYILPGIGIAGIFNLAFQAIEKVIDAIGGTANSEDKLIEKNNEFNKSLRETIDNITQLVKLRKDFAAIAGSSFVGEAIEKNVRDQGLILSNLQAQGQSQDKILANELKLLQVEKERAEHAVSVAGGKDISTLETSIQRTNSEAGNIQAEINKINSAIILGLDYIDKASKRIISSKDTKEKLRDSLQGSFDVLKAKSSAETEVYKKYFEIIKDLSDKESEIKKFNDDQERKRRLEFSKDDVSVNIEKNKLILNSDKKFHDDKEEAIKANLINEKKLIEEARINVVTNVTSTPDEVIIANNKAIDDRKKADDKAKADLEKNDVEFYQRKILATTEISKDEIELEAIANEKIFQNEQKSLSERLDAYEDYIIKKQKITQLERDLAIQKGAAGAGGATALTPEEQDRINVHNITQKYNTQADAEKKNYDITKQYLDQRIKDVKQANDTESDIDKAAYAKELRDNNERFKNKIFAYEAFKKNKEFIDKKYGVILTLEKEIEDDKKDVERLSNLYKELFALKEAAAQKTADAKADVTLHYLDPQNSQGKVDAKRHLDEAVGQEEAINDAIIKAQNELEAAKKKGDDDEIKNAKAKYEQLQQFASENARNKKLIEQEAWNLAEKLVNAGVDNEIEKIHEQTQAREEQFAIQQNAIEESTLSIKDKHAVEVQLAQQKLELDKAATLEERKIKHDAAVKDRELAVAHVLWNTAESVTAALKLPPPAGEILAAERAILGGLQVASILAVPIPSFKEGIDFMPKDTSSRYGEAGPEVVKMPGKKPFIAMEETISVLPKGTQIIPLRGEHPEFDNKKQDNSWEQTRWLAKSIAKSNKKEIKNVFKPTIVIDMNFEAHKRQILGY